VAAERDPVATAFATADDPGLDDASFTDLYERTARGLWVYVRRVCGDPAQADDVVQDAFLRLLRFGRPGATERERVSFLYKVATHIVYDHWRRRRHEVRPLQTLAMPSPASAPDTLGPDLSRLFETLAPRDRALLWLAHVEGWSHKEIAGVLGLGATSVRVLLFRARGLLRRRIARAGLHDGKEVR
jgi:RNA polymerase sigma-70 factor (ECF subfamily)